MRVAIFGGSFDPVHLGHLWIAEGLREHAQLDEVRFLPAAISPLKQQQQAADASHRVAMLRLAIAGHPHFAIDERELKRGGVSYTVDTVRELVGEQPEDQFYLILGADSVADLPRWRTPEQIFQMVTPLVVGRGGQAPIDWQLLSGYLPPQRLEEAKQLAIESPLIAVSSRDIRHRVASRQSIRYRVPRPVEAYIEAQQLYRDNAAPTGATT
jgi:nicotinate-nucleotide adenylyltransferase